MVFGGNSRLWGYRGVRPERWCDWYDYMVRAVVNHVYHRWQDLSSQLGLSLVASPTVLCMTLFCRSLFFFHLGRGFMYVRITSSGYMEGRLSPVDGMGHISSQDNDRLMWKIVYEFSFLSYYRRRWYDGEGRVER